MFHLHNSHMRGTRLDVIVGIAVLLFCLFAIVMFVGPVRTLAKERDEVRTAHVRQLMTNVLQLELIDPEAYERLVADVRAQGDYRFVIGSAGCGGSHGPECSDAVTADECLLMSDYFPSLLLAHPPVDPKDNYYSQAVTGYYLGMSNGELEVGACGAAGEPIYLRKTLE